jgi:hypothetical protein
MPSGEDFLDRVALRAGSHAFWKQLVTQFFEKAGEIVATLLALYRWEERLQ